MIFAFIAFVFMDYFASLKLKRFLTPRNFFWSGAIFNYIYHSVAGAMYLGVTVNKEFLFAFDVKELYLALVPAPFILCYFMMFFHCWAFTGGHKERP